MTTPAMTARAVPRGVVRRSAVGRRVALVLTINHPTSRPVLASSATDGRDPHCAYVRSVVTLRARRRGAGTAPSAPARDRDRADPVGTEANGYRLSNVQMAWKSSSADIA